MISELFRSVRKNLILLHRKIIAATRWQILRLKCIKFDFRRGTAPDPAGREKGE